MGETRSLIALGPGLAQPPFELMHETALAKAGFAHDRNDTTMTALGGLKRAPEVLEFLLPPYERRETSAARFVELTMVSKLHKFPGAYAALPSRDALHVCGLPPEVRVAQLACGIPNQDCTG